MNHIKLMTGIRTICLVAAVGLFQNAPSVAFAQVAGEGYGGGHEGDFAGNNAGRNILPNYYGIVTGPRATASATTLITKAIRDSYRFCDALGRPEYLVDCQGEQLEVIASAISKTGDYGDARTVLLDTSKKLRRLASQNEAPQAPRIRAKGTIKNRPVVTKSLTPVRRDRVKQVNQDAAKIMAEAETKLLRSAAASDRRLIAYAEISKAIGSNKTLLRSA